MDQVETNDAVSKLVENYLSPAEDPQYLGRIGCYDVMGVIGQGGTGVVLKALESRLNRFVAIKVLAPHLTANGPARKRFEREGRAIAAVSHEHVVPIYAVDEFRGLPYIVMQYIPGVSLLQRIAKSGPLSTTEVTRIGYQVALGLAAAHKQGIVHRDVKPANVLLEETVERAMVTDFGMARVADDGTMTAPVRFLEPRNTCHQNKLEGSLSIPERICLASVD
ncbi:MAG: serine/threonine-protein kinase [Pirellulaceae bacterium]